MAGQASRAALAEILQIDQDLLSEDAINGRHIPVTQEEEVTRITVLEKVLTEGLWEYVPLLIDIGADIDQQVQNNMSVLHLVLAHNNPPPIDIFEKLISDKNKNSLNYEDEFSSPLSTVITKGYWDYVSILMDHGATQWNGPRDDTELLLLCGCRHKPPLEIATRLVEANVNRINDKDMHGVSTLHAAMYCENWHLVPMLIRNGADVNEKEIGCFPLHFTLRAIIRAHSLKQIVASGEVEDVISLVRSLITPESINDLSYYRFPIGSLVPIYGKTPLHIVLSRQLYHREKVLLPLLVEHGASFEVPDNNDDIPFDYFIKQTKVDTPLDIDLAMYLAPSDPLLLMRSIIMMYVYASTVDLDKSKSAQKKIWFDLVTHLLHKMTPVELTRLVIRYEDDKEIMIFNGKCTMTTRQISKRLLNVIYCLLEEFVFMNKLEVIQEGDDSESVGAIVQKIRNRWVENPRALRQLSLLQVRKQVCKSDQHKKFVAENIPKIFLNANDLARELKYIAGRKNTIDLFSD